MSKMQEQKRNYRQGIIRIGHSFVWAVVCLWLIVTGIIGIVKDMPAAGLAQMMLGGAAVLLLGGMLVASIAIHLVVASITSERKRKVARLTEEFTQLMISKPKSADDADQVSGGDDY